MIPWVFLVALIFSILLIEELPILLVRLILFGNPVFLIRSRYSFGLFFLENLVLVIWFKEGNPKAFGPKGSLSFLVCYVLKSRGIIRPHSFALSCG